MGEEKIFEIFSRKPENVGNSCLEQGLVQQSERSSIECLISLISFDSPIFITIPIYS